MFNLIETQKLRDEYASAGLIASWEGGFINSIATSGIAPRGRGVEILDNLIKKGPPMSWPCWEEAKEILKIAESCTRQGEGDILRDFAARLQQGKQLSERQKWFLDKLKGGATRNLSIKELSEYDCRLIRGLEARMHKQSSHYWSNRPGTANRLRALFLDFNKSEKKTIDLESWDIVRNSFKGVVAQWEQTKTLYPAGTLCKISEGNCYDYTHPSYHSIVQRKIEMVDALIVSDADFDIYGQIIVQVFVNCQTLNAKIDNLVFPRKARKKKGEA